MKKQLIKLNENHIKSLINDTLNILLTENRESKNISLARKLLEDNGYDEYEDIQKVLNDIRTDIFNVRKAQCKFLLGVTRLYLNNELNSPTKIRELNNILPLICSDAHVNEYDYNLNDLSLRELLNRFSSLKNKYIEQEKDKRKGNTYSKNNDYTIVKIPNFETASKYKNYTEWCVTHSSNMYNNYTNDGLGLFYFCLKKGFENVEEVEGENAPLDEYGLSMIAVSVTENGMPNTITSRWNHSMGGNDSVMSVEQLEELLGVNFYDVFLPYSKEEIEQRKEAISRPFREANERLKRGDNIDDIFDYVRKLNNGLIYVGLNDKWSFIDKNGNLIYDGNLWLKYAFNFKENFCLIVRDDDKCSFIDEDGKLIGNGELWFYDAYDFQDGLARVKLDNNKWSFIDKNGELINNGKLIFDYVGSFVDGYASIKSDNNKYSFIDKSGKLIGNGNLWFKEVFDFHDGLAKVQRDDEKYSFIDKSGKLIGNGNLWFNYVTSFKNGSARVYYGKKWYYIDKNFNFYDINTKELISKPIQENRIVKQQVIRLTENDLHKIIENSVKRILRENK